MPTSDHPANISNIDRLAIIRGEIVPKLVPATPRIQVSRRKWANARRKENNVTK